jgi:predicted Rossmann fold flavoprotein
MSKVVVIGGGPAGMMAAITASKNNEVILIEKNEKLGKKLFITGKGRCNVTNAKDIGEFFDFIPTNPHFLYSSLYTYTNENTIDFFENMGIKLKVERGDRVFPKSDKSSDIIKALEKKLKENRVEVLLNSTVKKFLGEDGRIKSILLSNGKNINGDYFILCTGGLSYPQTGSTGEGLIFSKKLGHTIIEPKGSLVPIEVKENWITELMGLSLKNVELKILDGNNKVLYKDFGEMLFTHFGISGPIVISASSKINTHLYDNKHIRAIINLKPALDLNELDKRVQKDFAKYINKNFGNSLNDLLPKKIIKTIIRLSGIDFDKKVNLITKEERKRLVNLIQNFSLNIKGLRPIEEAIVTCGGVDTKEVDPSSMKSKLIKNLYFAGEVLDVDAYTGGYNIQIAFSTGYLAGMSVGKE